MANSTKVPTKVPTEFFCAPGFCERPYFGMGAAGGLLVGATGAGLVASAAWAVMSRFDPGVGAGAVWAGAGGGGAEPAGVVAAAGGFPTGASSFWKLDLLWRLLKL